MSTETQLLVVLLHLSNSYASLTDECMAKTLGGLILKDLRARFCQGLRPELF